MSFGIKEYVWDDIWGCPAVVIGVEFKSKMYRVAEITEGKKLGRVAERKEIDLQRYVNVVLPEDEALALVGRRPDPVEKSNYANARIKMALTKRGVLD